jgi:hypothetical protein
LPTKTKLDQYTELLSRSVSGLNEYEKWKPFLETASRLYKYKFRDQVMIHAQRPNATACADYNLWKRQDLADRYVKAGSKAVADKSAGKAEPKTPPKLGKDSELR